MRDLCIYQAVLTMIKSQQLIEDQLLSLFIRILFSIIEYSNNECVDPSQIISTVRSAYLWTVKLVYT